MPADIAIPTVHLHIGHRRLASASGGSFDQTCAVTGKLQAKVPLAGPQEIDEAVEAAEAAFGEWRFWKPARRRFVLQRLSELISEHHEELAQCAVLDGGTPIAQARGGVTIAEEWVSYYAGWADKIDGEVTSRYGADGEFSYLLRESVGVIGIIVTWNGPLISLGMKVAPALAAGCTVVIKPSEMTPFACEVFMRLVAAAGLPPGVVNMLPGSIAAGEALVRHPRVGKISFTGGPTAARRIAAACADQLKPTVFELGGKSASLIFPDVDLEAVCAYTVAGSIGILAGQGCALPTRLLIHSSIYERALALLKQHTEALVMGDPYDPEVAVGPLINSAARDRVVAMIQRAVSSGAGRLLAGGKLREGNYVEPTLFSDVDPDSEIAQVEVFGPVLVAGSFETEEEAISLANRTAYGLAAYIQTRDVARVHRIAERLLAGVVYVNGATPIRANTPFGGIGISGFGREGGRAGLDEYLRYKTVAIGG